jgi:hypothetical protein
MSFKLMDENLVGQATLTASSENLLFPVSNIQDSRRSKVFRSTNNSTNIVIDMRETSAINTIFVVADKRSGFGVSTIAVEFNATNSWGAPAYSVAVPFSTIHSLGFVELPSTINYRFARVVMTSTLGYCELSKIFIGSSLALTRSINFGWTIKDEELSQKSRNRYNQLFLDVISRQKTINFSMSYVDKVDLALINGLLDRAGETKPVYMILGCDTMVDDNRRFSGPVFLDDIPTITNPFFNKYSLSMTVREMT